MVDAPAAGAAYQRVAADLRDQIAADDLNVGDVLPSTSQLCENYSVSATVVKQAVTQLKQEGLLQGQAGKGVFVVATPAIVAEETSNMATVLERIDALSSRLERVEHEVSTNAGAAELTNVVQDLRRHVGRLETRLLELYGRLGQPYPHDLQTGTEDRKAEAQ